MTGAGHPKRTDPADGGLKAWLFDLAVGGTTGVLVAVVIAVNFVIFIGVERGYESSIGEVFEHSLLAGITTLAILMAGPILGVLVARRRRVGRPR